MTTPAPCARPYDPGCDCPAHWAECAAELCRGATDGRPAIIPAGIPSGLCPACLDVPTCPNCGVPQDAGGCDCYGIPTPVPHHPTSAELAAFRGWSGYCRTCGPLHHMDYPATRWERAYGTVRETGQRDHDSDPARHSLARREASAMRSRAYLRAFGRIIHDAPDWTRHAWTDDGAADHRAFEPR